MASASPAERLVKVVLFQVETETVDQVERAKRMLDDRESISSQVIRRTQIRRLATIRTIKDTAAQSLQARHHYSLSQ